MPDMLGDLAAEVRDLMRRIRVLESASPIGQSSVSEGALEIRSNEGLLVDGSAKVNGWLIVTGTERVTGRLEGSGTFDWTGPMYLRGAQNITGDVTFTGQMTVNGPWDLVGNGDITGDVNLTGDINVTGGGRIKAGLVVINPSSSGGVIEFGAGEIRGGDGIGLYPGSGPSIITSSAGVRIAYLPTIDSASAGGAVPGTVWCNAMGFLYRVT